MCGLPGRAAAMAIVLVGGALTMLGGGWLGQSLGSANAADASQSERLPAVEAKAPIAKDDTAADASETDPTVLRWLSRLRWWRLPPARPSTPAVVAASTDTLTVT